MDGSTARMTGSCIKWISVFMTFLMNIAREHEESRPPATNATANIYAE